jgi:uncharacterized Zn finger protein
MEYYVKRKSPLVFEVAKFDGRKEPNAVYSVTFDGKSTHCDCPAGSRGIACKHLGMVSKFIKELPTLA